MLPLDIHIEGQQVEVLPEWRAKIEAELGRLQEHYCGPILHARVEVIGTAHHHLGTFEVHLVVNVPGDIITIKQQGEVVVPLLVEAFDALDRRLSEHCQITQQKVKAHEEFTHHGRILRLFPEYGFIGTDDGAGGLFPRQCREERQLCQAESRDGREVRPGGRAEKAPRPPGSNRFEFRVFSFEF